MGWAVTLGSMALSAYSSYQEGEQAEELGEYQQQQYEAEAQATVQAGAEEARAKREEGRGLTAAQIAVISATGGGLVGSNLVVMAESARNVEMDALTIERNAQTRAKFLRARGSFAKHEGQLARTNARTRGMAQLLSSAGSLYGTYKKPSSSYPPGTTYNSSQYRPMGPGSGSGGGFP